MNLFLKNNWYNLFVVNIIIIYIVGVCGICFTSQQHQVLFLKLTPVNLIVTTLFLFLFHEKWNSKFLFTLLLIFFTGFFIEVIGVKTQLIFGNYNYGNTLGFQILNVPIIMGFNWLLLVYCIATSLNKIENLFFYSISAATIMIALDFLIEPIAMKLDFWQWKNNVVPLQNYIAWFISSFILFFIFRTLNGRIENKFAKVVLTIQFVFFALLNLLLK